MNLGAWLRPGVERHKETREGRHPQYIRDRHGASFARLFKRGLVHLLGGVHLRTPELGEIQILNAKFLDKSRDKIGDLLWFSLQNQVWPLNYCRDNVRPHPENLATAGFS
jgi:hypothetical protein